MNRILFEKSEIKGDVAECGGERAGHILEVLHGEVGQTLKTGEIDGKIGTGEIIEIDSANKIVRVRVKHDEEPLAPWVDLILAPPRPRVMKRLLPQLVTLGVGTIYLVGAEKVEKDFWGATLLKEENYRPLFIDGLMQCGTTAMPKIECRKSFRRFLKDELPAFVHTRRIVAHPYAADASSTEKTAEQSADLSKRLLLAIGPEGGWTDAEVEALEAQGFVRYSLGERILKTDTATIALLARLGK